MRAPTRRPPPGGKFLTSWSVVKSLKEMGVEFEDYDMPGLKTEDGIAVLPDGTMSAWFTDPEGNILAVDQMPD